MPTYEYQCSRCGERHERLRRLSDPPLVRCPSCGEDALERLVSAPAFKFKGSGWYVTDYAKKDGGKGAVGAAKEEGGSGGDAASKDTAAAASPDSAAKTGSESAAKAPESKSKAASPED